MKKLFREPLLHFLLIGAGMFFLFGLQGNPAALTSSQSEPAATKIVVTKGDIDQMIAVFGKTRQRTPSKEELQGLVEDFVRNEIYYREAIAIGLDRDDEVMKRRMRQRMEFIMEDVTSSLDPTDADLRAFMQKNPENYLFDPQLSFRQIYINSDKRGTNAESDARKILAQLNAGADPDSVGDPSLLEAEIKLSPLWDISKQFGEPFGKSLLDLKPGRWEGPIRSGYGIHLVFMTKYVGGRLPELQEVRDTLKRDWTYARQQELKDAAYARIRERYAVTVEEPKTLTAAAATRVTTQ